MADLTVAAETCVALGATEHQFESFPGRDIALGPASRHACGLADDHFVILHCSQQWPGGGDWAGVDIFRLDNDGKIVEHWNVLQRIPESSSNSNTMF